MLTLIDTVAGIDAAHQELLSSLARLATGPHRITVTHPQGTSAADAWYFDEENVWICLHRDERHFWNPCGTGFPTPEGKHNIAIEVNPPFEGRNAQVQGAFARRSDGEVVLVHRGRVGGNFVGATREALWGHARFSPVELANGPTRTPVVVVGRVSGAGLGGDLGRFVRGVVAFKDHLRAVRAAHR